MAKPNIQVFEAPEKVVLTVVDKFLGSAEPKKKPTSLSQWAEVYFYTLVKGGSKNTERAKRNDLMLFLEFFHQEVGSDHVDLWTPAATKALVKYLQQRISPKTNKKYEATSINRLLATIRHFGRWLHQQRPLLAGDPFTEVQDLAVDDPEWRGISDRQVMLCNIAIDHRLAACKRSDQNPLLEACAFHILLGTGLREFELSSLDVNQYHHKGFHNVQRKGKKVSKRVHVPKKAREYLDRYLKERQAKPTDPLLTSRYGNRATPKELYRMCGRIAAQANAQLDDDEKFTLTPHQLRHTYLRRLADAHGLPAAQKGSGNVSASVIFRYTQPTQNELAQMQEQIAE